MSDTRSNLFAAPRNKIGKQNQLPLSKAFEISLKSLRIRFWRSLITMSGIILAIAFLMWIWADGAFIATLRQVDSDDPNKPMIDLMLAKRGYATGKIVLGEDTERVGEATATPKQEIADSKNTWLVTLSLLVAGVGIINAMLMSVTERFREIGTMKCLGALDAFIVKLFLLESSMQGTVGTVLGIIMGLVANLLWNWISFGTPVFWGYVGGAVGLLGSRVLLALIIGTVLSVLGAIYPALVAARMEPVVAMRVDA